MSPVSITEANAIGSCKFNYQWELDTQCPLQRSQKGGKAKRVLGHQAADLSGPLSPRPGSLPTAVSFLLLTPKATHLSLHCALCFLATVRSGMLVGVERKTVQGLEKEWESVSWVAMLVDQWCFRGTWSLLSEVVISESQSALPPCPVRASPGTPSLAPPPACRLLTRESPGSTI